MDFFLPSFQQVWAGISSHSGFGPEFTAVFHVWIVVGGAEQSRKLSISEATSHNEPLLSRRLLLKWSLLFNSWCTNNLVLGQGHASHFLAGTVRSSVKASSDFLKITLQKPCKARIWWTQLSVENESAPTKLEKTNAHTGTNLILVAFVFLCHFVFFNCAALFLSINVLASSVFCHGRI